jgi:hypothetical protein
MINLSRRAQSLVGFALVALMIITRGHHLETVKQLLPSASWAVFFLAGVYLRPAWALAGLFALAAFLDFAAIGWAGVSDFCLSPAYIALIPAYSAIWLAGCWYARRYTFEIATLLPLATAVLVGVAVCEIISSGSFYFFSGRFAETTFVEFGARLIKYGPYYLGATTFWVGVAAIVHAVIYAMRSSEAKPSRA